MTEELTTTPQANPGSTNPAPRKASKARKVVLSILAGIGILAVAAIALQVATGWADSGSQIAYDAGVAHAEQVGIADGCATLREGKAYMDDLIVNGDTDRAQEYGRSIIDSVNGDLLRAADTQGHGPDGTFFISGFWDTYTRACPDAFYSPSIAGRPAS